MNENFIAKATIDVNASRSEVWDALIDPKAVKQYMFGTEVSTDWREGSPIIWEGEWEGKKYQDKGVILKSEPERILQYSHFSPLSGQPDEAENYHTVTIKLADQGDQTRIILTQDNNETDEERKQSQKNWETMLSGLKEYLEN